MPMPTIETARTEMRQMGYEPDRFGHYHVDKYRLKFMKRCIRVERRFRYESGGIGSILTRSYYYGQLAPGALRGLVKILKLSGGNNHGKEESSEQ